MTAWPQKKLGEVADLCLGKMLDQHKNKGEYHPYLANLHVRWGAFNLENLNQMRFESHEHQRYGLKKGDLVVCEGGEPGRCALWKDELPNMKFQKALHRVRPHACLDSCYLLYWFLQAGKRNLFDRYSTGSTIKHMPGEKLAIVEIDLPPLSVQRRIAGILSAYDELIENSQRRIRILESMARSLYREWFIHFRYPGSDRESGNEPSTRPDGHPSPMLCTLTPASPRGRGAGRREDKNEIPLPLGEGLGEGRTQFVDSALGKIPKGWEVKKLGDIAEDMRRNVPKGKLDEPKPYVGLEHIPRRSLTLDAWETATELGSNKLEFKNGEVLFGKIRPYFHKVSVAPFDGLCSADTIVVRARHPEHYAFVVACVSSDAFVAEASATANGAKMPRANWDVLEKYQLVIPKGKVAENFSALFVDIIAQQQALIFQIQNLRRTRDLLLPRLLSGQVEIKYGVES